MKSESIKELATALAKAQAELGVAVYDKKNPHFKSNYASLEAILDAIRPTLSKHGLCVLQTMDTIENRLTLVTHLLHSSGEWIKSYLPIITDKMTPQGIGSAVTYMRRYGLTAIVGIAAGDGSDDDGNAAEGLQEKAKKKPAPNTFSSEREFEFLSELSTNFNATPTEIMEFTNDFAKLYQKSYQEAVYIMSFETNLYSRFQTWKAKRNG